MDRLRPARPADVAAIERLVARAYGDYAESIGVRPGPMLDDYAARVAAGEASVLEDEDGIVGLVVLIDKDGYLLLDNVAVDPARQGEGLGRVLVAFAEEEARRRGFADIRLYTHQAMTGNIALYRRLGYEETHRVTEKGFPRVYMRKAV